MIIKSLIIENLKSIGEKITINFDDGLNILIGPNAGGKSNIMDILYLTLNDYIHHYERVKVDDKIQYNQKNIDLSSKSDYSRHNEMMSPTHGQSRGIVVVFSDDDISNIEIIKNNYMKIVEKELHQRTALLKESYTPSIMTQHSEIYKTFDTLFKSYDVNAMKDNNEQSFGMPMMGALDDTQIICRKIFTNYLCKYEKIKYILEDYNKDVEDENKIPELKYTLKLFSTYRYHTGDNLRVNLPKLEFNAMHKNQKEISTNKHTSGFSFASYIFARLYNKVIRIGTKEDFSNNEQVKFIRKMLKIIDDYDFEIKSFDDEKNIYDLILKHNGEETKFDKLSSGEKEVLNFIFSIMALDLKNAVVLIDEPEIHLHPQWLTIPRKLCRSKIEKSGFFKLHFLFHPVPFPVKISLQTPLV